MNRGWVVSFVAAAIGLAGLSTVLVVAPGEDGAEARVAMVRPGDGHPGEGFAPGFGPGFVPGMPGPGHGMPRFGPGQGMPGFGPGEGEGGGGWVCQADGSGVTCHPADRPEAVPGDDGEGGV